MYTLIQFLKIEYIQNINSFLKKQFITCIMDMMKKKEICTTYNTYIQ